MKIRSLDLIVEVRRKPSELVSHAQAMAAGWQFLCADIGVEVFLDRDIEIETPSRFIVAIDHGNGVNFYARPDTYEHPDCCTTD